MIGPKTVRAKLTLTTMVVTGTLLLGLTLVVELSAERTILGSIDGSLRTRAERMRRMEGPIGGGGFLGGRPGEGAPNRQLGADGEVNIGAGSLPGARQSRPGFGIGPGFGNGPGGFGGGPMFRPEAPAPLDAGPPRTLSVNPPDDGSPIPNEDPYDADAFAKAKSGQALFSRTLLGGEPIRVYSYPRKEGAIVRDVIQVAYPLGEVEKSLASLRNVLLFVFLPLGVILSGGAALLLVDRLVRPLRSMTANAARIDASSLAERLPVEGQDEFAGLAGTLNGMLDRLEEAFRREGEALDRQRRFNSDASHELKTPLAVIKANVGLLRMIDPTPEERKEWLGAIDDASDRMRDLVRDMLVLARGDAKALTLEPMELNSVLKDALKQVPEAGDSVTLRIPEKAISADVAKGDLSRVIGNLVGNAIRYAESPTPIIVSLEEGNEHAYIRVADGGIGIAPEHLPHLFDRFYRIDSSRTTSTGGTGLGLAICKSIVEAHGGSISVESRVGFGSTFTIELPISRDSAADLPTLV